MNKAILMGRLTRDPELRYTQSQQIPTCSFSVAVDRPGKAQDGSTKTDFLNCVAWRQTAEFISKYFSKGNRILVIGSIQTRDYTDKDGRKVTVTEIVVDNAEFCESKNASQGGSYNAPAQGGNASGSNEGSPDGFFPLDSNDFVPF